AGVVAGLLEEHVLPDVPCLIAVDHSLAGGAITALAERFGPENLSVVVLDAHTDAIPVPVTADAIFYDAETNPRSHYDLEDPLLHGRVDSYNASSFLHHLLESGIVLPRNLHLMGVADYPPSRAFRLEDPRMVRYTGAYAALKKRGVNILTRDDIAANRARVDWELDRIDTPYLYVSVDLDVGAGSALKGVRFRDRKGLAPEILESVAASLGRAVEKVELVGLDISEIDPRTAGPGLRAPGDRTYDFACLFIEALLGNRLTATVPPSWKGETCLCT
ncbi:MAG TPA: arginase family protein, partial [Thermoleophilia bacterium]|nr:arginase family protein [Thermoleophilia bacterium]